MQYPDLIAQCVAAKDAVSKNFTLIQGEKGYMYIEGGANGCFTIDLHLDNEIFKLNNQVTENLLYYELENFRDIFIKKDFAKCNLLLEHSYSVMKIFEEARKTANIIFPADCQ